MFVFIFQMGRIISTCNCHYFTDTWYTLIRHGQIECEQIIASFGVSNNFTIFYKSYCTGVIVIYKTTFLELIFNRKVDMGTIQIVDWYSTQSTIIYTRILLIQLQVLYTVFQIFKFYNKLPIRLLSILVF